MRSCFTLLVFLLFVGCVPFEANGTKHVLVIGLGLVSVPSATNQPAAMVTKTQAIGLILSDQPGIKAAVGISSSIVTQVPTNQNVLVEVTSVPGQRITVKSP